MPWITVPNFISLQDLSASAKYDLFEGFGFDQIPYREKISGKHYKKIWVESRQDFISISYYLNTYLWWQRYQPRKSFLGKYFGLWKKRKLK